MKRVRAACISQTLVFGQRPELALTKDQAHAINQEEYDNYKALLAKTNTRHVILDELVEEDGSIVVRIKKQYNDTTDVSEYF